MLSWKINVRTQIHFSARIHFEIFSLIFVIYWLELTNLSKCNEYIYRRTCNLNIREYWVLYRVHVGQMKFVISVKGCSNWNVSEQENLYESKKHYFCIFFKSTTTKPNARNVLFSEFITKVLIRYYKFCFVGDVKNTYTYR